MTNDCSTCTYNTFSKDGNICLLEATGGDCRYEERERRICPACEKEVYRDEMLYTKDCHGITFRLVCNDCYTRLMAGGYDGEYYTEADECIDDDY
ncbi:MAG: hypothetical protein NC517_09955 [Firmicutes bacterium]|nr:hypothetical protein [Bacillota bacterium]